MDLSAQDIDDMMREADKDGDGVVKFEEFRDMILGYVRDFDLEIFPDEY